MPVYAKILGVVIALGIIFLTLRSRNVPLQRSAPETIQEALKERERPLEMKSCLMSDEQKIEFREILNRLDAAILKQTPEIHAMLSAPATDEEIRSFRDAIGGAQIDALEELFRWHAGCEDLLGARLTYTSFYLGMDFILLTLIQSDSMGFLPAKRRKSFQILHDHAGDGYFFNTSTEVPYVFHDMLEDSSDLENFGNIVDFFRFILEVWETTDVIEDEQNLLPIFDEQRYFEIEAKHLKGASK